MPLKMDAKQTADHDRLRAEHQALKAWRLVEEPSWRRIIALAYPDGTLPDESANDHIGATRSEIYDNTAEDAGEMAAAAFHAMTTNTATRWMEMGVFDRTFARDTYGGHWLWDLTDRMLRVYRHPSTLFSLAIDEDNPQWVHLGNACLHVEDRPGKLPLYRACPITNIWWDENADGEIDTVNRLFEMTPRAAYTRFGRDNIPQQVYDAAVDEKASKGYRLLKWLHVCRPRNPYEREQDIGTSKPFRSVYLCLDHPGIVDDGGSYELEYIPSRGRRRAGRRYGRGFGHKALSDIDILQRMTRTTLVAGERTIEGPLLVPDDDDASPVSLKNRALNRVRPDYLSNGAAPRPLLNNTRVDIGLELIADRRELVRRSYAKQLLELSRDPKFTATQFLGLQAESQRGLAPILLRHNIERLGPLVARTYNILKRMPGVIPPPPPEISQMPLQPEFDSPEAKSMRLGVASGIAHGFEALAPAIKATMDDAAWDNFDLDEGWRTTADGMGFPTTMLRPVDVRDRMREQRQLVARQRAELENVKDFTTGLKNAAPMASVIAGLMKDGGANGNAPAAEAA